MTEKEKILLDYCTEMVNKFNIKPVRIRPMRSISKREYKRICKKLINEFINKRPMTHIDKNIMIISLSNRLCDNEAAYNYVLNKKWERYFPGKTISQIICGLNDDDFIKDRTSVKIIFNP